MTADRPALTARQRRVLAFAVRHFGEHLNFPSLREIMAHFGIRSPNGIVAHMRALVKKGYLIKAPALARGYRIADLDAAVKRAAGEYLKELREVEVVV
jgi:repressor LexA